MKVTCEECGNASAISEPADPTAENRWKCPECGTTNVVEGHPGEPGEGAINPAAAALSDAELAEAYERRIVPLQTGGAMAPEGSKS